MLGTILVTEQFKNYVDEYIFYTQHQQYNIGFPLTKYISFLCPPAQFRYIKQYQNFKKGTSESPPLQYTDICDPFLLSTDFIGIFVTEMILSFLWVTFVLHVKNQSNVLRQLNSQEIKNIVNKQINNIKEQINEPEVFYQVENKKNNDNDIDYDVIQNMISYKAIFEQNKMLKNKN